MLHPVATARGSVTTRPPSPSTLDGKRIGTEVPTFSCVFRFGRNDPRTRNCMNKTILLRVVSWIVLPANLQDGRRSGRKSQIKKRAEAFQLRRAMAGVLGLRPRDT